MYTALGVAILGGLLQILLQYVGYSNELVATATGWIAGAGAVAWLGSWVVLLPCLLLNLVLDKIRR